MKSSPCPIRSDPFSEGWYPALLCARGAWGYPRSPDRACMRCLPSSMRCWGGSSPQQPPFRLIVSLPPNLRPGRNAVAHPSRFRDISSMPRQSETVLSLVVSGHACVGAFSAMPSGAQLQHGSQAVLRLGYTLREPNLLAEVDCLLKLSTGLVGFPRQVRNVGEIAEGHSACLVALWGSIVAFGLGSVLLRVFRPALRGLQVASSSFGWGRLFLRSQRFG